MKHYDILICGAGIAGVACAEAISARKSGLKIGLIDRAQALSFTTSCSGENYRDFWPQPPMTALISESIDLMHALAKEHPDQGIGMRENGYEFISTQNADIFQHSYFQQSYENGQNESPFSSITDKRVLRKSRPYLATDVDKLVRVKRAGVMDVYAFGMLLLKRARSNGVEWIESEVTEISRHDNTFTLDLADIKLTTTSLVLCAGPFNRRLARQIDLKLPLKNYRQHKFVIPDPLKLVSRDMPFTIIADSQKLVWSDEEREAIEQDPAYQHLLATFPPGLHVKPEGVNQIKIGWAYNQNAESARWQVEENPEFVDICMRGAARHIPALKPYINQVPTPLHQFSGYYTRTEDNLPIIGQLDDGVFTVAGLSGFGTMAACAAGQLCAGVLFGEDLPKYAPYFSNDRFQDAKRMREIAQFGADGQL